MLLFVERPAPDALTRQVWQFDLLYNYSDAAVVVDYYAVEQRGTPRQKWRLVAGSEYRRRCHRPQTTIRADAVPLPVDVIEEARAQLIRQIPIFVEADRSK
jgi:hypothetical protein